MIQQMISQVARATRAWGPRERRSPATTLMNFHDQSWSCHPERCEGSRYPERQAPRSTQGDKTLPMFVGNIHYGRGRLRRNRVGAGLVPALVVLICILLLLVTSCSWPGAQQAQQTDARLKLFHVLSARIIMLDTSAEVDGSLQNTSHTDRFPYDVTVIATFYNSAGNIVGQAGGIAEDVYPGMTRPFTLVGSVDSTQYSHMVVTVVSLKERRIEKYIPTPSVVP